CERLFQRLLAVRSEERPRNHSARTAGAGLCDVRAARFCVELGSRSAGQHNAHSHNVPWVQKTDARLSLELKLHRFSICRYDLAEGNVLTRLGDVLYWLGCILAAIVMVWGVRV